MKELKNKNRIAIVKNAVENRLKELEDSNIGTMFVSDNYLFFQIDDCVIEMEFSACVEGN